MNNRLKWAFLFAGITVIAIFTTFQIVQINQQAKLNFAISEECITNGGTLTIQSEGLFQLQTRAYCDEE